MRWKTGLGSSRKNSTKRKEESKSPSSKKGVGAKPALSVAAISDDTPGPSAHNLGAVRVGILRTESAPVCTPTPRAKRQLISELLEPENNDGESESHNVSASSALRGIISNKSSSGKNFDKEAGKGDAFTSYTPEEKVAFACHLNAHLLGDPFLQHLLPLDPGGADLFDKFRDGILLCRIVCLAVPGSIADSRINKSTGPEPLNLYRSTENLNVALRAAEGAGLQVVNIGASDIISGRPASILGLSWQLVRVHLLAQINLKRCPDLVHLMKDDEEKEAFFALPVEEVLLRWFNHHLRWGGSPRRVTNFSDDLVDGYCYMALMKELNDEFQECDFDGEDPKRAQFRRACLVISGAEGIGVAPLIRPRHITGKAHLYNIAFVAQLLNRRPRIHRERLQPGAATALQSWYRMLRVMYETTPLIEERRAAVTKIACVWRARLAVKRQERDAATRVQAWWRATCARSEALSARQNVAATKVQACWRGGRARKEVLKEKERKALVKVQACWRGVKARNEALAARKEVLAKKERMASIKLQACWRAAQGRKQAGVMRREKQAVEEAIVAARRAEALRQAKEARAEAARAAELAMAKAEDAKTEADAALAKAEAEKDVMENLAAARLQAWARGMEIRKAMVAVRAANIRGRLDSDDSSGRSILKEVPKTSFFASPRTSIASSVRSLEESPEADGRDMPSKSSSSWFNKVFAGISFAPRKRSTTLSPGPSTSVEKAEAASVIQRWRKQVVEGREEMTKAMAVTERRRWAVRTLHRAYCNKWRLELARRSELRRKKRTEDEARAHKLGKATWLGAAWGDLTRGVASAFEYKGGSEAQADEEATDCCDAKGHSVLASEVRWKSDYVTGLVLGKAGVGDAQEERAKELSRRGSDARAWTTPENALSPAKCAIMMAALAGAVLETTLSTAAASGI